LELAQSFLDFQITVSPMFLALIKLLLSTFDAHLLVSPSPTLLSPLAVSPDVQVT
jgi:hypothetical protein